MKKAIWKVFPSGGGRVYCCFVLLMLCMAGFPLNTTVYASSVDYPDTFSAGCDHAAVIAEDGDLYTFGSNANGRLGRGDVLKENPVPGKVENLHHVVSVSAGYTHTAAVTADGKLYTWGSNNNGQLGTGDTSDRHEPVEVMTDVARAVAGYQFTLAVKKDGSLYGWGQNWFNQFGSDRSDYYSTPQKIIDSGVVTATATCSSATCFAVIKTDGTLWTWGNGNFGQLGNGTKDKVTKPQKVAENVTSVYMCEQNTVMIKTDGTMWACGVNYSGEVDDSGVGNITTFTKVMDDVKAVAAGARCLYAIRYDGSLWAWGSNINGNIFYQEICPEIPKTKVMDDVLAISSNTSYALVLKRDGTVLGCGNNSYGQLGMGEIDEKNYKITTPAASVHDAKLPPLKNRLTVLRNPQSNEVTARVVIEETAPPKQDDLHLYVSYKKDDLLMGLEAPKLDEMMKATFEVPEEMAPCDMELFVWDSDLRPIVGKNPFES